MVEAMSKRFGRNQKRKLKQELLNVEQELLTKERELSLEKVASQHSKKAAASALQQSREISDMLQDISTIVGSHFLGVFGIEILMENIPEVLEMAQQDCNSHNLLAYSDLDKAYNAAYTINRLAVFNPEVFNDCINKKMVVSLRTRGGLGYSIAMDTEAFDLQDREYLKHRIHRTLDTLAEGMVDSLVNKKMINSRYY